MKKNLIAIIVILAVIGSIAYFENTTTEIKCNCNDKIACSCKEKTCECQSCHCPTCYKN